MYQGGAGGADGSVPSYGNADDDIPSSGAGPKIEEVD
jgi:hypothetical protein